MNTAARLMSRLAVAGVLALPLLACGNKGPLTLAPRPASAPAPAIEVDVPPPADAPVLPVDEAASVPQDDDPR